MAMTERKLRQIIKEEAQGLLRGRQAPRRGLREGRVMGGDMGGHGEGDDLVHVESDNPEVDRMFTEWQELTYALVDAAGNERFEQDEGGDFSMRNLMLDIIDNY
jgi:hypothetical protein